MRMKRILFLTTMVVALFFGGCEKYDDSALNNRIDNLEERVRTLEELCRQMNTNISSLQTIVTALQNNDYVTGVAPVTKNGETIGYTIIFTKSQPITIYHGENGKDGQNGTNGVDGKDGSTPVIGVKMDDDGIYYWTLNGEWLTAGAGCVFILREGEKHNYRAKPENPWHKLWINYNAEYTGKFLDAYGITTGVYHAPEARQYFERAIELADAPESFIDLCYLIAECVHSIASSVSARAARGEGCDYSRIRDALDLSVYKKCDLDAIAKTLHMSKSNMIRVFKKHYGVTPYDYLLDRKIETAKLLLNGTSLPVREIADKLCILDEHYFSSLFLKRAGVRPREYRKIREQ